MHQLLSKVAPRLTKRMVSCLLSRPVLSNLPAVLGSSVTRRMFDALYTGLSDYTIDERGDVGSWIRMACMDGLTAFAEILVGNVRAHEDLSQYLPPDRYHLAVAGILKQGVERLDNVRACAGVDIFKLLNLVVPSDAGGEAWKLKGATLMQELFLGYSILAVPACMHLTFE
jgi:tubulin-specific chaperone D